jgi:ribosomal protein L40E
MRLFRRTASSDPEPERCPLCNERVPDDAEECAMCGANLRALRPWSERRGAEPLPHD